MSKIQFNELNNTSLEVLNSQEVSTVVGGRRSLNFNLGSFNDNRRQGNNAIIFADTTVTNVQLSNGVFGGNSAQIIAGASIGVNQTNQ
ncbi:hypothetical protein I4641_07285 [Waterburya agarophytonicola K14]|uniref:Uncharacterized protein n=1 Tax=Waterburya agarophytonicola KI4 TaxID=2874699 RepID=A0A964BS11_9CYAN|nr:hypothetical protein [Waterburya agarophytonicola]MCC0176780.1 hypothetical protein [Waterburya agarophytonicola KI4]